MKIKLNLKLLFGLDTILTIVSIIIMKYTFKCSTDDFSVVMDLFSVIVLPLQFVHICLAFCLSTLILSLFKFKTGITSIILIKVVISLLVYVFISLLFSNDSIFNELKKLFTDFRRFTNITLPYLIGLVLLSASIILFRKKIILPTN